MLVYMEIVVIHNSVFLKSANLDNKFSHMTADLIIDRLGGVKVFIRSESKNPSF